ncbi:MAG TPA: hypothetical protein VFV58_18035 [Blastocatellia bacterium]|jgi:hypothetical protein|nr:hypothetical protein [Blastocatellia bacterium]
MKKDDHLDLENRRPGLPEDGELNRLLASWQAPESLGELDQRALASYRRHFNRGRLWRRWLTGSIHIPVPIATAAVLLLCATSFLAARRATTFPIVNPPAAVPIKIVEVHVPVFQEKIVTRVVYKNTGAPKTQERPTPISIPPRIDLADFRPVNEIKIIVSHGGNDAK